MILKDLKEIGEWNDLIIQHPLQIEPQALEIGELVDKKLGKGLVPQQVVKHQVEEEMEHLLLKHHLQGSILIIQPGFRLDLKGLLKLTTILKMLLFLVLKKASDELVEEVQKILVQTLLIKDHLLKVLIHHRQESPDQEITVQDLMINTTIIID